MNFIKQFLTGAIGGFIVVSIYFLIPFDNMTFPTTTVLIILYAIVLLGWIYAFFVANDIKRLAKEDLEGDDEDEAEDIINKKLYDYSFSNNVSAIFAVLGMSIALLKMHIPLLIVGVIVTLLSYSMTSYMMKLYKLAYPNRNLPDVGDKDYAKKLMDISDGGERHIMLHGLYKAYNFANIAFVFAIIGITLYSLVTEDSQLFSIIVISLLLLMMNAVYLFSVRNR